MNIKKLEKTNLVDEVYEQLHNQIISGKLREGEKIASENKLADSFDVSRVVIREALQRLRSEKHIITKHGLGSFVTNQKNYTLLGEIESFVPEEGYDQLLQFREAVEFKAIRLSTTYGTEEDFKRLFDSIKQMKLTTGNLEAYSYADYDFHYAVVQCSHNQLLVRSISACKDFIIPILMQSNKVPNSHEFGVDMHYRIAEAIAKNDAKGAINAYKNDMKYTKLRLQKFYKKGE